MASKLAFLALLLPLVAAATEHYEVYGNSRFGFTVDIPSNFVPQGESDNGDGQVFVHKSTNARIIASGGWLMEPEIECSASARRDHEDGEITYRHAKGGTSVISGKQGSSIFYAKTVRTNDRCLNLLITYPHEDREMFDSVVKRVSRSFDG